MNKLEIFMTIFMVCVVGAFVASLILGADVRHEERRNWWEGDD